MKVLRANWQLDGEEAANNSPIMMQEERSALYDIGLR